MRTKTRIKRRINRKYRKSKNKSRNKSRKLGGANSISTSNEPYYLYLYYIYGVLLDYLMKYTECDYKDINCESYREYQFISLLNKFNKDYNKNISELVEQNDDGFFKSFVSSNSSENIEPIILLNKTINEIISIIKKRKVETIDENRKYVSELYKCLQEFKNSIYTNIDNKIVEKFNDVYPRRR